jgi:hypothetical protein
LDPNEAAATNNPTFLAERERIVHGMSIAGCLKDNTLQNAYPTAQE